MGKNSGLFDFLIIGAIAIFAYLANTIMRFLEFEEQLSSITNYLRMLFFVLTIMAIGFSQSKRRSSFTNFWFIWIVWLFFDFYLLGLKGEGIADYLVVILAPLSFILFYYASLNSQKVDKIALIGFIVIFILALIQNVQRMDVILLDAVLGEEGSQSNIVYWCLCPLPFLMMVKKRWQQIAFLLVMGGIGLYTGKRSVFFVLALVYIIYVFYVMKGKKKFGRIILINVIIILAAYVAMRYLGDYVLGLTERLSHMGEQGDSSMSRVMIYEACFKVLRRNDLFAWLFGHGYETVRVLTPHTNAHNDALQMLFEYGIVGLFFYICMVVYSIKRLLLLRRMNSTYYLGYATSVTIFIVLGLVSNLVVFYSYFSYICAFWGMAEARLVQELTILKNVQNINNNNTFAR